MGKNEGEKRKSHYANGKKIANSIYALFFHLLKTKIKHIKINSLKKNQQTQSLKKDAIERTVLLNPTMIPT